MKRKATFVFGLAAGYVLGARAGRGRYEQIKSGAAKLWETTPVVRCRIAVKGFVGDRVVGAQDYVIGKGKKALYAVTNPKPENES